MGLSLPFLVVGGKGSFAYWKGLGITARAGCDLMLGKTVSPQ